MALGPRARLPARRATIGRVTRSETPVAPLPAAERARVLDFEHRKRARSVWPRVLGLGYLTTALGRLGRGTAPVEAPPVARPAAGTVSISFVGHATVMITTPAVRILCDPLLENSLFGVRRAKAAGIAAEDLDDVDLVLITHAHRDHLSRASIVRIARKAVLVVPPRCTSLVRGLGFADIVELDPGNSQALGDVEVTAVPVRHSGTRGLGDYLRRGACGYLVHARAGALGAAAYLSGDTGYFSGFTEIGRRFHPDVALLPIAGYEPASFREEHLSPLDALYAFDDLGARLFIPTSYGSFPFSYERLAAPLAWLRELARARGLGQPDADRRVAILDHGQTLHLRMRA
jgi:L-ascorbate metabolism protein UlaG (beta-lactamase superfamily)